MKRRGSTLLCLNKSGLQWLRGDYMFKSGFLLNSDPYLEAVQFNKQLVTVWKDGFSTEKEGIIEYINSQYVVIHGTRYYKSKYDFRIF